MLHVISSTYHWIQNTLVKWLGNPTKNICIYFKTISTNYNSFVYVVSAAQMKWNNHYIKWREVKFLGDPQRFVVISSCRYCLISRPFYGYTFWQWCLIKAKFA